MNEEEVKPASPSGPTKKEKWELRQEEKTIAQAKKQKTDLARRVILWAGVVLVVAAVSAFMIWFVVNAAKNSTTGSVDSMPKDGDWVQGPNGAPVVLIEYSDFQCPACGAYYPLLKQLRTDFGDKMQFVYRYFPLKNIHKNAVLSASAAEAAGKQGKFWEMHDILFEKQTEWAESDKGEELMIGYAAELKLNLDQFKADLNSQEVKDKVESAYVAATSANITSTPTFFLNGERLQNPKSYDEFKAVIQGAIDAKSQ